MKFVFRNSMLIIAGASLLAFSSCKNATNHGVRAKLGAGGGVSLDPAQDQANQKIDQLIQENKSLDTCSATVLSLKQSFDTQNEMASTLLNNRKDKAQLTAEDQQILTSQSANLAKATQALMNEILKRGAANCGTDQKVSLSAVRETMQKNILDLSAKLGKDTAESTAVKKNLKRTADAKNSDQTLNGMKFKMSLKLAEDLNQDQQKVLFVKAGATETTKEKYELALQDTKATVCLLDTAPEEKVEENDDVTVVVANQKEAAFVLSMTVADQVISFSCRLGSDVKKESVTSAIQATFANLLTK